MIFFLFRIEIEGKGGSIIGGGGGGQRVYWPPSQIIGGCPTGPPLPTPLRFKRCQNEYANSDAGGIQTQ